MNDDSNFFGDVFEDPDDDPLLGGEEPDSSKPSDDELQGRPSWMSEDVPTNGESGAAASPGESEGPNQKQVVVDQKEDAGTGIDELNQAVEQGWRLVRISLARPDGEQVATAREAHRFVAILEQENPQSLFDFGAS